MQIDKNFKEFIELLNAHEVKYLVVGGYAVNFYGYFRFTKDIDFWIWVDPANAQKVMQVLDEFGFGSTGIQLEDLLNPQKIVQLGFPPNRIDLIMEMENMDFQACFERRKNHKLSGAMVSFLGFDDLIFSKENAGRLQDLADAEALRAIKAEEEKLENALPKGAAKKKK